MKEQNFLNRLQCSAVRTVSALVSHPQEPEILPPCRRNQRAFNGARSTLPLEWRGEILERTQNMRRGVAAALALLAVGAAANTASAQSTPVQCNAFIGLRDEAQKKALAVRTAVEHKVDRKEICGLVQRYFAAESTVLKFLEDNKTWCGIPEEAIKAAKDNHEHTGKFRTAACQEGPVGKPKEPSLSDAIGTPSVDTGANTRTGRGTLDSLNGNPLAR
jgi:hypothetical protein